MKVMLCLLTLGLLGSALAATRLVQWKPGLCSDNPDLDGTGIPVVWPGVTRFCSLQVNFVPFQSYIVRADFKYELVYYETINGKSSEKKIVLPGVDTFLFDGTSNDGVDLYQSDEIQTN